MYVGEIFKVLSSLRIKTVKTSNDPLFNELGAMASSGSKEKTRSSARFSREEISGEVLLFQKDIHNQKDRNAASARLRLKSDKEHLQKLQKGENRRTHEGKSLPPLPPLFPHAVRGIF
jgi:hypothetical protein